MSRLVRRGSEVFEHTFDVEQSPTGRLSDDRIGLAMRRVAPELPDSVRDARIEDFLSWAKNQLSPAQLLSEEHTLLRAFGAQVQTDHGLHTTSGLLDLFDLAVNNSRDPIHGIPLPAIIFRPCTGNPLEPCYVTANHHAEAAAYQALITPTSSSSTASPTAASITDAGLIADPAGGQAQASALGHAGLPVYYPNLIQAASTYCSTNTVDCDASQQAASEYAGAYPRAYGIEADGHDYSGISNHDRRQPGTRRIRRRPRHDLAEPADPQQPHPIADSQRQEAVRVLRPRASGARCIQDPNRGLLDLEHAHRHHPEPTADRYGRINATRWLTATRRGPEGKPDNAQSPRPARDPLNRPRLARQRRAAPPSPARRSLCHARDRPRQLSHITLDAEPYAAFSECP